MAVALATLPSKSRLAGGGETFFATTAGSGLPGDFTDDFADGVCVLAGLAEGLAEGLAAALRGILLSLVAAFFAAALGAEDLPALTFFAAAFFGTATFFGAAAFLATAAFFGAAFFAAALFAAGLLAGEAFLPGGFATTLDAAGFCFDFTAAAGFGVFFAADLATARPAFAGVLLAFFTTFPFAAVVFDAAALTPFVLFEALSFCALALELPVVFAISLHRGWPWRPGVIAHVSFTSKPGSGILVTLHPPNRSGSVNPLTRLILWLLRLYKRWISPLLGPRCRFHPSCSDYARIAVIRFGPWRGSLLAGWRLLRCQPLCTGGEDPVPQHFHYRRCRCPEDTSDAQ